MAASASDKARGFIHRPQWARLWPNDSNRRAIFGTPGPPAARLRQSLEGGWPERAFPRSAGHRYFQFVKIPDTFPPPKHLAVSPDIDVNGIPSPPIHITTELLPDLERELGRLCDRVATAHDPLGTLFSVFGID